MKHFSWDQVRSRILSLRSCHPPMIVGVSQIRIVVGWGNHSMVRRPARCMTTRDIYDFKLSQSLLKIIRRKRFWYVLLPWKKTLWKQKNLPPANNLIICQIFLLLWCLKPSIKYHSILSTLRSWIQGLFT